MVSFLKALLYGAGGVVVVGMATLVAFQEKLVYVPALPGLPRPYSITPARLLLNYEDVWLRSSDGVRLHSWFVKHDPPVSKGKGEELHGLMPWYGESDGYPSQHGIIKDAQAALDHLTQRNDIDTSRIVVFGRSLGGAVGSVLAKNNPDKVSAIILENTFTSILDMASVMMPFLKWFIGGRASRGPKVLNCLVRSPWSTIDIIGEAALDHLTQRNDIDTSRIVVFGRSLGGAVGSVLAKNNPDKVSAIILENTFTSILDMASVMMPFLKWFIGGRASRGPKVLNCLVRSPWSTIDIIGEIKQPILFLSGLQDELVPPSHMQMLYSKAVEHNRYCRFVDFPTGMHMDTWFSGGDRVYNGINATPKLTGVMTVILQHDDPQHSLKAEPAFFQPCLSYISDAAAVKSINGSDNQSRCAAGLVKFASLSQCIVQKMPKM
ncbi:Protein bem46-like protein [Cocos nucifera]|nr:Protein bem46-like protein [Cocos nucifera]